MNTIYKGQTKKFPTDLSGVISVPVTDLTGLRAIIGVHDSKKVVKEWRWPTESDYGIITIVDDNNGLVQFVLDSSETLNAPVEVCDLEIGMKDSDSEIPSGQYVIIAVSVRAFEFKTAKIYQDG